MLFARRLRGPFPIFCRGHSGGRLLSEAFVHNGVDMGVQPDERRDTAFFSISNPVIERLVTASMDYASLGAADKTLLQDAYRESVQTYVREEVGHRSRWYGWKIGISIFTMPVFFDAFPQGRAIHLIRDGRDVMLSRLNARLNHLDKAVNRIAVFGDSSTTQFRGHPLNAATVNEFRNALEMLHWKTAVAYGLQGRAFPERYLEVRYEAVCRSPALEFERIFDFLEVPFRSRTKRWLRGVVNAERIGKWTALPPEALTLPLEIGGDLLTELGYT